MSNKTPATPVVYKDEKHVVADTTTDTLPVELVPVSAEGGNLITSGDDGIFADISIRGGHGIATQGDGTAASPVNIKVQRHGDTSNLVRPESSADNGLLVTLHTDNSGVVQFAGVGTEDSPLTASIQEGVVPAVLNDEANMLENRDGNMWAVELHKSSGKGVSLSGNGTEDNPLSVEAVVAPGDTTQPNALALETDGLMVDRYKLRDFEQTGITFMTPEVPKVVIPKMGSAGYENIREELLVLNGQNTEFTLDLSAITGEQSYNRHIRVVLYSITLSPSVGQYTQGYSVLKFITNKGKIITPHGKVVSASKYKLRLLRNVASVLDIYFGDQGRVMLTTSTPLASDQVVYSAVHEGTASAPGNIGDTFKFTLDTLSLYGFGCAYAVDMQLNMMLLNPVADGHSVMAASVKCYEGNTEVFNAANVTLNNTNRTATFTHTYSAVLSAQGDYGMLPQAFFEVSDPSVIGSDFAFRYHATVSIRRIDHGYTNLSVVNDGYEVTTE
ncbi:TPA: hypothetical protein RMT71_003219 [Escherichia coli]|nr:hypothetical protein [Escherichia coli]